MYYKTKKRAKRSRRGIEGKKLLILTLLAIVMLFMILSIRCCVSMDGDGLEGKNSFTDKDLIFDDAYNVNVYICADKNTVSLPLDEYIFHVVAGEMPAGYGVEALKAQAIAARTYTVAKCISKEGCGSHDADVCTDSKCCQAWKTLSELRLRWGFEYSKYCQKLYDAVVSTSGLVAMYQGEPINAMYHAVSGGITESYAEVYGNSVPYLQSVESPNEEKYKNYNSTSKFTYAEAVSLLNKYFDTNLSKSTFKESLKIISRSPSGRVSEVQLGDKTVTGREMRHALSLKSSNFYIEFTKNNVILKVVGYGHGVGMSQAGAAAMAESGANFQEILTHYYTGINIEQIGDFL